MMLFLTFSQAQTIDIVIACVLTVIFSVFYLIKIKKFLVMVFFVLIAASYLTALFLGANYTASILQVIFIIFIMICSLVNISSFRKLFLNMSLFNSKKVHSKAQIEVNATDEFYNKINETVKILSKTKTGALLTFEKKDDLTEIMKNGTQINSPISVELIQTIFYPGTRLHDGAIVIRGDKIVAASVYYTPTTKALTGKYGSRHRAAFGISEISDSVTVVVSEETGRISIAYEGRLEPVAQDEFLSEFVEYMAK